MPITGVVFQRSAGTGHHRPGRFRFPFHPATSPRLPTSAPRRQSCHAHSRHRCRSGIQRSVRFMSKAIATAALSRRGRLGVRAHRPERRRRLRHLQAAGRQLAASVGALAPLAYLACAVAMGAVVMCCAEAGGRPLPPPAASMAISRPGSGRCRRSSAASSASICRRRSRPAALGGLRPLPRRWPRSSPPCPIPSRMSE